MASIAPHAGPRSFLDVPRGSPDAPELGLGVGLRTTHYPEILARLDDPKRSLGVDWLEILSENYMIGGGRPLRILDRIAENVPLVMHGVSMNLGSIDPLDTAYLGDLERLAARTGARWISDHLCWTGVDGRNLHDLMPLPYTQEALDHVVPRIREVQDRLERRIAIENVSSYLSYRDDAMSEWSFLSCLAEEADCGILLDVNNVFVSAHNHHFDANDYIDALPPERVFQIHLAGHSESGPLLIDTHDHPVRDEVWDLYAHTIERLGPVSTLIEWDEAIPPWSDLLAEGEKARSVLDEALGCEEATTACR